MRVNKTRNTTFFFLFSFYMKDPPNAEDVVGFLGETVPSVAGAGSKL